jgi:hypothetical protein
VREAPKKDTAVRKVFPTSWNSVGGESQGPAARFSEQREGSAIGFVDCPVPELAD